MTGSVPAVVTEPGMVSSGHRRALFASSVGNVVEWFDFAIYGYLAVVLGDVFFPSEDPAVSLLSTFAVFAAAFAARPLGGLVFGPLGDKIGRRPTLAVVIVLMSAATFLVGCLPGHDRIGVWAPVLLVLLRLVQGLSAGGEVGSSSTYLAEIAPSERRGIYTSAIEFSTLIGLAVGSLVVLVLGAALTTEQMHAWGWRAPFLLGGLLGVVGLYIRLRLQETPAFESLEAAPRPPAMLASLRRSAPQILMVIGITAVQWVGFYLLLTYLQTYLVATLGTSTTTAAVATATTLLVTAALIPLCGRLSDLVGRRPLLLVSCVAMIVLLYPVLQAMAAIGGGGAVLGQVVLGIAIAPLLGTVFACLAELFPPAVRVTGFSLGYNICGALLGGTTPFVATAWTRATGDPMVPAYMLMGAAVISTVTVLFFVKETARDELRTS